LFPLFFGSHFVGKHDAIMRELRHSDFDPKEKFWTRFPPEGSKSTPPHQSVDLRWKDYCPMVFRYCFQEFLFFFCGFLELIMFYYFIFNLLLNVQEKEILNLSLISYVMVVVGLFGI